MKRIVSPAPALPCAALRSGKKNAKRLYFSLCILTSSPFKIASLTFSACDTDRRNLKFMDY